MKTRTVLCRYLRFAIYFCTVRVEVYASSDFFWLWVGSVLSRDCDTALCLGRSRILSSSCCAKTWSRLHFVQIPPPLLEKTSEESASRGAAGRIRSPVTVQTPRLCEEERLRVSIFLLVLPSLKHFFTNVPSSFRIEAICSSDIDKFQPQLHTIPSVRKTLAAPFLREAEGASHAEFAHKGQPKSVISEV